MMFLSIGFMSVLFLTTSPASAESRPDWIDHPNLHDSDYKYYIGRAPHSASDSDAVYLATSTARKQAISENFGTYVQFESEAYKASTSDSNTLNTGQTAHEISDQVRLKGFEQQEIYFERTPTDVSAWILFKYPTSEIKLEISRLESLRKNKDTSSKLRLFGSSDNDDSTGMIEVHSYPGGLPVQIDTYNEMLGRKFITPFQYRGIPIGKHIVKINDPKFLLYQEEVVIHPGTPTVVNATMKQATAGLLIKTSIEGATISVGSNTYQSPMKRIIVPVSEPIFIQISHPEAKKIVTDEFTISRNEDLVKNYDIALKPALVSINSSPEGAGIYIDQEYKGMTPATVEVISRKSHSLSITKEGYEEFGTNLDPISGGSTRILSEPFVLLKTEIEPTPAPAPTKNYTARFELLTDDPLIKITRDTPPERGILNSFEEKKSSWLGLRLGGDSSSLKKTSNGSVLIGLFGELQPFSWIGFPFGADFGSHTSGDSSQQSTRSKGRLDAGVNLYLITFNRTRFFLGPQWMSMSTSDSKSKLLVSQYCFVKRFGVDFLAGSDFVAHPVMIRLGLGFGTPLKTKGIRDQSTSFTEGSFGVAWGFGGE